ncbi:hypothetical protein D8M04_03185 [Oceanobacillus piezotolerans]|uniref:Uncharacterized protein n=1 Tax=Oceanobacillus piezotolerans TaxID=2448030 RepID=A0A498DDK6_9BACI|nr:hypothetical protein [Oceanobacillus piezotolerans]RLL48292.1 hypothetical protein D8M04_03185 [Oceanobacillus piezotolerans]
MINKINAIPERIALLLGIGLILFGSLFLFLFDLMIPLPIWLKIWIEGAICFIAILFILSAADKRHRSQKKD